VLFVMKIEIEPLDARALLPFLREPALQGIAVQHYALDALSRLLGALEEASIREESE